MNMKSFCELEEKCRRNANNLNAAMEIAKSVPGYRIILDAHQAKELHEILQDVSAYFGFRLANTEAPKYGGNKKRSTGKRK